MIILICNSNINNEILICVWIIIILILIIM